MHHLLSVTLFDPTLTLTLPIVGKAHLKLYVLDALVSILAGLGSQLLGISLVSVTDKSKKDDFDLSLDLACDPLKFFF